LARCWVGCRLDRGNGLLERLLTHSNSFAAALLMCSNERGGGTCHNASGEQFVAQGVPGRQRLPPERPSCSVAEHVAVPRATFQRQRLRFEDRDP
jgi:hypothetical protein